MILRANEDPAGSNLPLKMALEAKVGVTLLEHLLVHRTVDGMAGSAPLPKGFVLEDKGTHLS